MRVQTKVLAVGTSFHHISHTRPIQSLLRRPTFAANLIFVRPAWADDFVCNDANIGHAETRSATQLSCCDDQWGKRRRCYYAKQNKFMATAQALDQEKRMAVRVKFVENADCSSASDVSGNGFSNGKATGLVLAEQMSWYALWDGIWRR